MTEEPLSFPFPPGSPYDPPPELARLRGECPVARVTMPSGDRAWVATRHADVRQIYADRRFSRAATAKPGAPAFSRAAPQAPSSIIFLDPPEHSRLRRLIAPAFHPQRIRAFRPVIERITAGLLDELAAGPVPADLVAGFAKPLPMRVICHVLGVPYADHERFAAWGEAAVNISKGGVDGVRAARAALEQYLTGLIAVKRREPADDVLTALVQARDEQDRLTEAELLDLSIALLLAGYETTVRQLACCVVALLRHPDQLAMLRERPELLDRAVDEMLRHTPLTTINFMRVATEDVELGGVTVRAGEAVMPLVISANRDPAVFADPDRLDITRADNPHLAFGHGAHYCTGAQLARIELAVALDALLRRFPQLKLAVADEELVWRSDLAMSTVVELPVAW
jgi:cytochrome P450